MQRHLRTQERTLGALAMLTIVLVALASTLYVARFDLTSSGTYTLSKATKNLDRELTGTVRITYYVSRNLSDRHPGPRAIEDFLREVEAANKGTVRVSIVDPTKKPEEAERLGLAPQQMQIVEQSEQRVALVYTGIVVEYLDRLEVIPAILSTETLEYELVKAIRAAAGGKRLVAGLLVGDQDKSLENDYRTLQGALAQAGYEPRAVERGQAIDDDVDVLYVLGNAAMDRYDAAFVDAYVMKGGKVFFAVKGVNVSPEYGLAAMAIPESGILPVLERYGFTIAPELLLDQSSLTVPFQTQGPTGGMNIQYMRYPHWVAIDGRYVSPDSQLTARFAGLDLFWPSPLSLRPVQGVTYKELAQTTTKAWLQKKTLAAGPDDQALFAMERNDTSGQYLVAASASGKWKSAFDPSDLPTREGAPAVPLPPAEVSPETRMVVVSSADFLTDLLRMSDSGFNASFAVLAADWLTSADDLIAIKARTALDTRLNRIRDEDTRNFLIILTYLVTLGLVPAGVIAYGLVRQSRRNRAERESRQHRGGEA